MTFIFCTAMHRWGGGKVAEAYIFSLMGSALIPFLFVIFKCYPVYYKILIEICYAVGFK